jgi:hypothetical protein
MMMNLPDGHCFREQISTEWTNIAADVGAASVRIVNDVDSDELPPDIQRFAYLESGYK